MVNAFANKHTYSTKHHFSRAFTLAELVIVIVIIGVIGTLGVMGFSTVQKDVRDKARESQATIIADALEKYYDDNNEYPSVALMTTQDSTILKNKLKIKDVNILKFPLASASTASSIAASNPSPTQVVYSANTTDNSKNTQCQTDVNGYCDGFQLQYVKESDGTAAVVASRYSSFMPVAGTATCGAGETQSGQTCTRTYAATAQPGTYTCPSGGTLSGSTCSSSYAASYASTGSYTCPSGGTLSGTTCTVTQPATQGPTTYSCPNGGSVSGSSCTTPATLNEVYACAHPDSDTMLMGGNCRHERPNYNAKAGCEAAGYTWGGSNCLVCMHRHYKAHTTLAALAGLSVVVTVLGQLLQHLAHILVRTVAR